MLAVCLTGELRWFALALSNLRHLLLSRLGEPWRGFYVGAADRSYLDARPLLLTVPIASTALRRGRRKEATSPT